MKQKTLILLLLAVTMFLVVLDAAIVNLALPAIKESLHFSAASLQWVLTAYILTFGGFLLLGGRTADLYGRRRVLLFGIGGFTLASLLLGFANSEAAFIVLRALQGLAAAFMAPTALSILLTTFQEGDERNKALSVWSLVASGGAAAGVFLGGLLTQYLGWQWCFFVNVPIGLLGMWGILKFVPAHIKEESDKNLDLPGAALVTSSMIALVYGLTMATEAGWASATTWLPLGASVLLLAAFIWNESKVKHPLVPLSIFKIRNVSGANLMMVPISAGALGMFFFSSLYVQNVLHYSPVQSGLAFLPIPIIIGFVSMRAPRLLGRFGFKPLLITGTALIAIGVFLMSLLNADSSYLHMLAAFVVLASGFGITFVSNAVAATSGVPGHEAGLASGLLNTSQQVGGALGLAILAVVASSVMSSQVLAGTPPELAALHGYQQAFQVAALLMVIALFIAIFVIRAPKQVVAQPAPTQL